MAAWVEATTREMGQSLINPDKPSVSSSALPGDTEKPALSSKPHLMPKPFSLQRNATVRPIRAPKTNFSRQIHRAVSSETLLNTTDTHVGGPKTSNSNGTVNGSGQSAAPKPVPLTPKPDLQAKPKPEPTKSPDITASNNQTGPNSKPDITSEDMKSVQPRSRAKSLGVRDQKTLNQKAQGEAGDTEANVKVPSRCWPARNRLSVELTSKFESLSQLEKEVNTVRKDAEISKTEKEEPPHSPSVVSESKSSTPPVEIEEVGDEELIGGSIKRRISLLFDRSAASQRRDTNKRDITPAEISIDIKQRIQNLSLDTPRTRLPSTGAPKSPPSEKSNERSSERETETVPVDKPPNTTEIKNSAASVENAEQEENNEVKEDKENYVTVPVYRRVGISIDAEKKRKEEEEKLRKDEQLEKERQQQERERLLEDERKAKEIERQQEEERKQEEEKQRQMEERRKQEEEWKRRIEEERKEKERERQREQERQIEEEKKKQREEQRLRQEKLKKEREMEEERRRIQEMERQKEEERLRQEREKEERLKKEREMEEERRRVQEMERQKEEERLRKEQEIERIKKEREIEERKRMEEERLREEREREKERLKKEEERSRIQEMDRRKEEESLRQERESARLKNEMEMERCKAGARLREEVPTSYNLISFDAEEPAASPTLVSTVQDVSPQLTEVLYDDFSVKPRRWGTRARRSSTPSPPREPLAAPVQNLQSEPKSSDPGSLEPCGDRVNVDLIGFDPEASSPQNSSYKHTDSRKQTSLFEEETESKPEDLLVPETESDEGQLMDCEPEEDGVEEEDTETLIGEPDEQSENNDETDGLGTESRLSQALQRLTRVRRRNTSTDSDAPDVPDEEESEPLPVLETAAPPLDSSILRSKVDLAKKRSIKRSRPTRAVRQRAALPVLTEGANPDWRFCDSTDAKDPCSNGGDSESEEEPSQDATSSPAPSQPKRVPMFPGMDPSALMAQLKRRSGVMEADSPTEVQTPPAVPARSPRTPTMALGPRVLPPVDAKDSGSGSSPSWLLELKSKKRMNQPESEA